MKYDHAPAILSEVHNGIPVVRLLFGPYEADICPLMGANCIRFAREGIQVLRTPPALEVFKAHPNVFGMPLLFPPNRIRGGVFPFQEREYRFPINEPERGHHIHGFLSETPFRMEASRVVSDGVSAVFSAFFGDDTPYLSFPHAFSVRLSYGLNASGLTQTLALQNNSALDMPAGLGFHTAFQVPFLPDTAGEEYRLFADVGDEICLDPATIIPTGERRRASAAGQALREGSLVPAGSPLSHHFERLPGEITLRHGAAGAAIRYAPDPAFSFLMLWNGGGQSGFVCPEPQTWQVDAPHSPLPAEKSGFKFLRPGEILSLCSTLCIDPGKPQTAF